MLPPLSLLSLSMERLAASNHVGKKWNFSPLPSVPSSHLGSQENDSLLDDLGFFFSSITRSVFPQKLCLIWPSKGQCECALCACTGS